MGEGTRILPHHKGGQEGERERAKAREKERKTERE